MPAPLPLLIECLLSALFSLLILRILCRPLGSLLERLCPDSESAAFWRTYSQIMLVLAPLLCVLVVDLLAATGDPASHLRIGLIASLGGLLFGLRIVGKRLARFVEVAQPGNGAP